MLLYIHSVFCIEKPSAVMKDIDICSLWTKKDKTFTVARFRRCLLLL